MSSNETSGPLRRTATKRRANSHNCQDDEYGANPAGSTHLAKLGSLLSPVSKRMGKLKTGLLISGASKESRVDFGKRLRDRCIVGGLGQRRQEALAGLCPKAQSPVHICQRG